MSNIIIVDYGMGNIFSVQRALKFVGRDAEISSDPSAIIHADRLILPGVGAFEKAMHELNKRNILESILEFVQTGRPVLGICLGMQLLFTESFEFGHHRGLNLIKGKVVRFKTSETGNNRFKIPQIGWNQINPPSQSGSSSSQKKGLYSPILEGIIQDSYFYFVHSYICLPDHPQSVIAETVYGNDRFCSVANKDNIWGCQFHPEKSGESGLLIYKNFVRRI